MFPATPTAAYRHRLQPEFYGDGRLAPKMALDGLQRRPTRLVPPNRGSPPRCVANRADAALLKQRSVSGRTEPWRVANIVGFFWRKPQVRRALRFGRIRRLPSSAWIFPGPRPSTWHFWRFPPLDQYWTGMNTTNHAVLVEELLSRKGNSAGWGHHRGSGQYSAEATALATLAGWQQLDLSARTSILDYWKTDQLPDGGWSSIAPSSSTGNWPTAIIANTLAQVAPRHPCLPPALRRLCQPSPARPSGSGVSNFEQPIRKFASIPPNMVGAGCRTASAGSFRRLEQL